MNKLKLVAVTELKTAKDGRAYYTAEFQDVNNPFANTVKRNFWQQKNAAGVAEWRGASYDVISKLVGTTVPGSIATRVVEEYQIGDRTANIFTTVLLGAELDVQVFKALGHELPATATVVAPAEELTIG